MISILDELILDDRGVEMVRTYKTKWKMNECPRCQGSLYSYYGEDFTCLQCGWVDYKNNKLGDEYVREENKNKKY